MGRHQWHLLAIMIITQGLRAVNQPALGENKKRKISSSLFKLDNKMSDMT